jgi:Tol biopolymer transport system component
MTAELFLPGLVSGPAQEYGLAVTHDWSEIYFTRLEGESSAIMWMRRTDRGWSMPSPTTFSDSDNDSHPWLSPDGSRIFFVSRRLCPGANQATNLWVAERTDDGWGAALSPGPPVTDQTMHAPSVSARGAIYATGIIRLQPAADGYRAAERLSPDIRGAGPAVAPDESFLVFSARRAEGLGGADIYVTFAGLDGTWSAPVNLGPGVNTESVESSPTLSTDGRFLFFSRHYDIWWVDSTIIEALRPEP